MGRERAGRSGKQVSLVEHVRPTIDARWSATRCEDAGCSLSLDGLPEERLLIRADQPAASGIDQEAMCDFIWFDEQNQTAAIELKRGHIRVGQVVQQLQNGTNFVADRLVGYGPEVRFRPILACKGKVDKRDRRELKEKRANWIGFRGGSREIKIVPCDSPLKDAL